MTYVIPFLPCDCDTCKAAPNREKTLRCVMSAIGQMLLAESGVIGSMPRDVCSYSFATAAAATYAEYLGVMLSAQVQYAPEREPKTTLRYLTERILAAYHNALERE